MISEKQFQLLLECYHKDVPFVGTITEERANELIQEEKICRGWMLGPGGLDYFHIIKSPTNYPEFSLFSGESEEILLEMTAMLCIQNHVEFEQVFFP